VSIGATLAAARRRAGLTVSEVSRRASVTEAVILGIEQDDYTVCGGDLKARDQIRAIAGAVGEDPVPLMDEFDSAWQSVDGVPAWSAPSVAARSATDVALHGAPEATGLSAPEATGLSGPGASDLSVPEFTGVSAPGASGLSAPGTTGPSAPGLTAPPAPDAAGSPAPDHPLQSAPEPWMGSPPELTAEEAFPPARPARIRERSRVRWMPAVAVLVLAVFGFAAYQLASGVGRTHRVPAAASQAPARTGGQHTAVPSSTPTAHVNSAQPSPPASAAAVATKLLTPASVTAFGPAGTADGDNPAIALRAIGTDPATPWYSDWYTTPDFAGLQPGTGLLLDLGRTVTITSVRLSLGANPGADLQLRAGSQAVLADLRQVASSADAHGTVRLLLSSPVRARYLLIWFVRLPPDSSGTYQVSVSGIKVRGPA
jgi:Helix-turn-helix domain